MDPEWIRSQRPGYCSNQGRLLYSPQHRLYILEKEIERANEQLNLKPAKKRKIGSKLCFS